MPVPTYEESQSQMLRDATIAALARERRMKELDDMRAAGQYVPTAPSYCPMMTMWQDDEEPRPKPPSSPREIKRARRKSPPTIGTKNKK